MAGGALDGSAGATPHSGSPFGLAMRFGSHSSSLVAALSFYTPTKKKNAISEMGEDGRTDGQMEGRTDKVFLARVKLLAIAIEPKLLFAAHLKYKKERRARGKSMENRLKKTGVLDGHVPGLPSGCADRIAFA